MKVPVYRGLANRITLAAIPRNHAILIATLTAAGFFTYESLYVLVLGLTIYAVLYLIYRVDEYCLETLIAHMNQPDYYEP